MTVRTVLILLALLTCCGICHGKEERWLNFAEDADQKYYLDPQSVHSLPDNVFLFWVKSVAKDKAFYKREYNLSNLSYIFTNYELDCAVSSYRVRGSIMYDKSRREISKSLPPSGDAVFEPVPPESVMELAQQEICVDKKSASEAEEAAAPSTPAAPPTLSGDFAVPEQSAADATTAAGAPASGHPAAPAAPAVSTDPAETSEPAASADPVTPAGPAVSADSASPVDPAVPAKPTKAVGPAVSVGPLTPVHLSSPVTKGS